jgi:hypothetical protein
MTRPRTAWRARAPHLLLGGVLSLALVLGVATLSARPAWQSLPEGVGLLRLSLTHSGVRACRDRTAEELAKLPSNMRTRQLCDRRRAPIRVEMDIDGRPFVALDVSPSGLAGSGPSRVYERFELPAGSYRLDLRLADDPAVKDFAHRASYDIMLESAESVAIDFDAASGGFFLHGTGR